jgi:hypothetical protein
MTDLASCLMVICDPVTAGNPVAWHELHKRGLTRESLEITSTGPDWQGPKPVFSMAPAYDDPIWLLLEGAAE